MKIATHSWVVGIEVAVRVRRTGLSRQQSGSLICLTLSSLV